MGLITFRRKMPKVSILIPTYSKDGIGKFVMQTGFTSIAGQTFKDFEVIVADQSQDNGIEELCEKWSKNIPIKYFRNLEKIGYLSNNENKCIKEASGEILKFLDMDDFFLNTNSLQMTVDCFQDDTQWLATSYYHTPDKINLINKHDPVINSKIYIINTIGTLTCVSVRNRDMIFFDENLRYMADCEFYKRAIDRWGLPKILNEPTVVQYLWQGQSENTVFAGRDIKDKENSYVLDIYEP